MAFIHKPTKNIFGNSMYVYRPRRYYQVAKPKICPESNELPVIILCLLCIDGRFSKSGSHNYNDMSFPPPNCNPVYVVILANKYKIRASDTLIA